MEGGAMKDTAKPQGKVESGRSAYRRIWWMRFWLPLIALIAWWYFAITVGPAYHLAKEGVVVSGEVTQRNTSRRTDYNTVRFTTPDGRPVETTVAPKTCGLKHPGDPVEVRYLPSDPYTAQDACDSARNRVSWGGLLLAVATTALSGQAWRLWLRHRKTGQLPAAYRF
jgi:hypothetical protein